MKQDLLNNKPLKMENKLNNNFLDNKQKQKFHKLNNSSLTTNFDNIESHSPLQ